MATSKEDMQTNNLTFRRYKEGDHEWSSMHDKIFREDTSYKCPTYVHRTPPCQGSCPSGEDIRGWLDIVRGIETPPEGMTKEEYAFQRSTTANPFPAMMGRVCPAPCQDGCNRNDVDDFVGINSVEQYIGDSAFAGKYKFGNLPDLAGKTVAIIGGGVAGMSAAYHLRKFGIASTIFDDHSELGGMMRYGIPGYRTPRDVMNHECMRILDMGGIETKLNTRVGKDVAVADLEKDYDAVLWALGCKNGRGLFIDNWKDVPNAVTAVDFLEQFNKGEMKYTGKKIVCVGGGDTSIDVVSVSRRIGTLKDMGDEKPEDSAEGRIKHGDIDDADKAPCTNVTLTALFKQEEMTAAEHEVQDALKEGVTIMNEVMPVEIITDDNGRATALKLVDSEFVNNAPVAKEGGKEYTIECDLIVSAIGQFGDLEGVEDMDNGRSLIDADKFYQVPGKSGHFVAGDIVRPHLLTTAIGQGSVVAETIKQFLDNKEIKKRPKVDVHHFSLTEKLDEAHLSPADYDNDLPSEEQRGTDSSDYAIHNYQDRSSQEIISTDAMFLGHFEAEARNLRTEDVPSSDEVLGHFTERMNGLAEEKAVAEAGRCMSCGMCFECDNCVIFCPQDAVFRVKKDKKTTGRYVDTDYSKCVGCHICADVCPTGYIDMGMGE